MENPVQVLWFAVIRRALFDWVMYKDAQMQHQREVARHAGEWIFVPSTSLNSFDNACRVTGLDPDAVRASILYYKKEAVLAADRLSLRAFESC